MSRFELRQPMPDEDPRWKLKVGQLKQFLDDQARDINQFEEAADGKISPRLDRSHPAYLALVDVERGDFEAASLYLDKVIGETKAGVGIANDQRIKERLEARLRDFEIMKQNLERE